MKKKITLTELKSLIKKMVINEITQGKYPLRSKDTYIENFTKALESVLKGARAVSNEFNPKITLQDGKGGDIFDVELYLLTPDKFNLVCIYHGSDRKVMRNMTEKDVVDFIKKDLKDISDSYVTKAYKKSMAPYGKKDDDKKKDKEEDIEDEMEEVKDIEKQVDIKATENEERDDEDLIASTPGKVVNEKDMEWTAEKKVGKIIKPPKIDKSPKTLSVNVKSTKKLTVKPTFFTKKADDKLTPKHD
jgi:hypothetical protein